MIARRIFSFGLMCSLFAVGGCSKKEAPTENTKEAVADKPASAPKEVSLNGAGATFPFPLYSKWMAEYNKLHPEVRINYQSIGSGGGIRQITAGTVDFGASDAPMTEEEEKKAPGKLVHIPTTIGAVAVSYNLPGVTAPLKLAEDVVVDIFRGKIKKWNDPRIAATNEGVKLPDQDIAVVHRSDGSGTTAVFTGYLASVSPEWKAEVGEGKSVKWPTGLGAKGNEGVTGQVKTTPGAVGYIELAYAKQNKLPMAAIKNRAGEFMEPKLEAVTAAGANATMPDTLHVSLWNQPGAGVYPIAAYTYLLVYEEAKDPTKGDALAKFAWWAIHDGQKFAAELEYAPLPESVIKKIEERLKQLKSNGKPILPAL
jgi:phosphate transport system substrate-binding protein